MGKVIEKIKLSNIFDPSKFVEIDAVIDSGSRKLIPNPLSPELPMMEIL